VCFIYSLNAAGGCPCCLYLSVSGSVFFSSVEALPSLSVSFISGGRESYTPSAGRLSIYSPIRGGWWLWCPLQIWTHNGANTDTQRRAFVHVVYIRGGLFLLLVWYSLNAAAVGVHVVHIVHVVHVVHIRAALRLSDSLFCCRYRHAGRAKHHTGGAVVLFRTLSVLSTLSILRRGVYGIASTRGGGVCVRLSTLSILRRAVLRLWPPAA